MSIMISIPLFALETYRESVTSFDNGIPEITAFKDQKEFYKLVLDKYIDFHKD